MSKFVLYTPSVEYLEKILKCSIRRYFGTTINRKNRLRGDQGNNGKVKHMEAITVCDTLYKG